MRVRVRVRVRFRDSWVGEGTQAVEAPAASCEPLVASMDAMSSGSAHMPLPICARPTWLGLGLGLKG